MNRHTFPYHPAQRDSVAVDQRDQLAESVYDLLCIDVDNTANPFVFFQEGCSVALIRKLATDPIFLVGFLDPLSHHLKLDLDNLYYPLSLAMSRSGIYQRTTTIQARYCQGKEQRYELHHKQLYGVSPDF